MMDDIARALANVLLFLEYSTQETWDEDAPLKAMEQLGGDLKNLDADHLNSLCSSFRSIAQSYEGEFRTFVADLPEALGLEGWAEDDA
jgi:hypothetical protein